MSWLKELILYLFYVEIQYGVGKKITLSGIYNYFSMCINLQKLQLCAIFQMLFATQTPQSHCSRDVHIIVSLGLIGLDISC